MTDIESILERNSNVYYRDRWHPTSVSTFEESLKGTALMGIGSEVRKNIAYALQYLEYIQLQFDEIRLHSIIETQLMKTFIITAMGVIESIFHHIVITEKCYKTEKWEDLSKPIHTNTFIENGVKKKYIISIQKELKTPRQVQMDFEYLINKVQEKKLLSLPVKFYPQLKHLKRLRNKVHLHIVRYQNDTDYLSISKADYLLVRYILFEIMTKEQISLKNQGVFEYLRLNEKEMQLLNEHIDDGQEDYCGGQTENAQPE